jgi:hypothetical protein
VTDSGGPQEGDTFLFETADDYRLNTGPILVYAEESGTVATYAGINYWSFPADIADGGPDAHGKWRRAHLWVPYDRLSHHQPIRPCWLCRHCSAPWPCLPGMADLVRQFAFQPTQLFSCMAAFMPAFEDDLFQAGDVPGGYVLERFVDWIRPAFESRRATA